MGTTQSNDQAPQNPNQVSLDHLTSNPQYQNVLRNLYSNNTSIPAHPGAFIVNEEEVPKNIAISIKKTVPIENLFLFDKNSAKITRSSSSRSVYYLSFKFSCKEDSLITVYFMAKDITDNNLVTQELVPDERAGEGKAFPFYKGTNIEFPSDACSIDTSQFEKQKLCTANGTDYPVVIVMQKQAFTPNQENKLFVYGTFSYVNSQYVLKVIRQKLQINGRAYILDDIFGIGESALTNNTQKDSKECAICLTEKTDTVVFPCKHMCLCFNCAKDLKDRQNQKCPMCRKVVEYFLKLEGDGAVRR